MGCTQEIIHKEVQFIFILSFIESIEYQNYQFDKIAIWVIASHLNNNIKRFLKHNEDIGSISIMWDSIESIDKEKVFTFTAHIYTSVFLSNIIKHFTLDKHFSLIRHTPKWEDNVSELRNKKLRHRAYHLHIHAINKFQDPFFTCYHFLMSLI